MCVCVVERGGGGVGGEVARRSPSYRYLNNDKK